MYYYGGATPGYAPMGYAGTTTSYGYGGFGAALFIVLFILLVIIVGAGWSCGGRGLKENCC